MIAGHEVLDHTGELGLRVWAPTLEELFAEAGRALREIELPVVSPAFPTRTRTVAVRAPDRPALLVEWLNELVYLAERDRWVATEFGKGVVNETEARFEVTGVETPTAPSEVKAATLHNLRLQPFDGGWEAEVILDV